MDFPKELTAEALFKWQAELEAQLERVLLDNTGKALSAIVDQAMSFSLTAASARHLWEEAVSQSLRDLDMGDDRFLLEDLVEAGIGDDAYEAVQQLLSKQQARGAELSEALYELLDLDTPSLLASGVFEELAEETGTSTTSSTFWSDENWIEQTGTGHLPRYIRAIADELKKRGYTESRAIATAVNTVKRWARRGPARQGGRGHVSAKTQAKAIAALVEWEAKRAEARATHILNPMTFALSDFLPGATRKNVLKWKVRIKRQVRTAFTGVVGRIILAEMRARNIQFKTWVTKHDDRVRPTHRMADGQTVPIDQPFRVGFVDLMYPGERGKPLEETANCRCLPVPSKG